MRIIIDIGHPGHVHLFKHVAHLLIRDGAEVLFTARDKEFELDLLKAEGFTYMNFGRHYRSLAGKILGMAKFDTQMLLTGLLFKPDLFMSHGSIYAAHAAWMLGKKHLSLEDTGNMEQVRLYRPFTDAILTPDLLPGDLGAKQIRYKGYHEIAYLHPEFFTPDPSIYSWLGLQEGDPFAIIRFISWNATHDVGHKGISNDDKVKLVQQLSKKMKVFITSETGLSEELRPFRFKIPPDKFHHALNYASLVVSEGTTTATEAGLLGTPCVYISTLEDVNCQEMEEYDLVFNTTESAKVFQLVEDILGRDKEHYIQKSREFLQTKVNVTRYLYDFIQERYGKSGAHLNKATWESIY
ncbi:MAG: DUF354 domain-containing protein [Bacteroidetes bacterium]|nr:MAG: DUF354 domain-containing protein [Bacteroidota bacterium]